MFAYHIDRKNRNLIVSFKIRGLLKGSRLSQIFVPQCVAVRGKCFFIVLLSELKNSLEKQINLDLRAGGQCQVVFRACRH